MKLQQIHDSNAASRKHAYKMADLTKKMSPDNPTQILTTHDLSSLRTVQRVLTAATVVDDNPNNHHSHSHSHSHSSINNNSNNSSGGNLVFSPIPLDGHALLIQHSLPGADVAIAGNLHQHHQQQQQQQQRSTVTTTTNGLRLTSVAAALNSHSHSNHNNNNNNNHLSNLLAKAGLSAASKSGKSTLNGNMPATSKYVLLQQNGNGQFTTYEGTTAQSGGGNIVLLATEPMDLNGSVTVGGEPARIIATGGDNDEELRPLAWLNDSNLIKGIVTTTAAAGGSGGAAANGGNAANIKRQLGNNICIVNAGNAHELIEELPLHVAGEEHVSTASNANNSSSNNSSPQAEPSHGGSQKITALSVSDFQQQFKRFGNIIATGTPLTLLPQDATAAGRKDEQHIFGNIAAIGATTTVHVGPSGTTTVVEYKSNANFLPVQRPPELGAVGNGSAAGSGAGVTSNTATTITATNLSNNNNHTNSNYVPSSSSTSTTTASSHHQIPASVSTSIAAVALTAPLTATSVSPAPITTTTPAAVAAVIIPKQLTLPGGGIGNNSAAVVNGNNTTNTIYQGQQKQQSAGGGGNGSTSNNNSSSSTTTTTTHHPHKKYLREKMNVLDHGGGGGSGVGGGGGANSSVATITVVASPASSTNSLSSTASTASSSATSSSTAAVNGGNSPISKTFYTGHNNSSNTAAAIAINYSNSSNSSTSAFVSGNAASASSPTTSAAASPIATSIPAYTIMQYPNIASSPVMSSPEPPNSKDYYTLITPQQQQQQRNNMRSPTSYSSYDNDSLKDFEVSNASSTATIARHNASTPQQQQHQQQQQMTPKANNSHVNTSLTPQKQKHPNNVPYDPFVHTHSKPPYSFSSLIFMAIEGSNEKALPVKEIYAWIVQHFPYFKSAPTGWKNSVRHNLSLNKSFIKVEKAPNMGKGSLWRVEPQQRPNLIQALSRSPFFPNSAVDKIVVKSPVGGGGIGTADSPAGYDTIDSGVGVGANSPVGKAGLAHINPRFDPRLFPKLSKAFKDIGEHGMLSDVADDEIPSDYSTSNHASHNHNSSSTNSNNNNATNNNNNSHNNKYSAYSPLQNGSCGSGGAGGGGSSGGVGSSSIMGAFSNYESIERLARDCGADSIEDVNAATAMLALKHGPKVFAETFQNGAPVITSSPSEDHTYSAGGGGSGASTPLTNGNAVPLAALTLNGNGVLVASNCQQNGCASGDNQSNCASSDAAYESSEENHNITPEELADQQRHLDGVDALLSLSLSSVVEHSSSSRSPTKRPSSTSVEEEHTSAYQESSNGSIPNGAPHPHQHQQQQQQPHMGKMTLLSNGASYNATQQQQQPPQAHHAMFDEGGYSAPSYYGSSAHHAAPNQHAGLHLSTTTAAAAVAKKVKPLRSLRTKMKRKTLIR